MASERGFVDRGGPAIGVLVILLGLACLLAALVRPAALVALPAGSGAFVLAVWCAWRLRDFVDNFSGFGPASATRVRSRPGTVVVDLGRATCDVRDTSRRPREVPRWPRPVCIP